MQSAWVGGGHDGRGVSGEPLGFVLEGWDVSELAVETGGVVPVDPLDGGELGALAGVPGSSTADELGLVGAVERFDHRVVVRIADRADRRGDAGLGEPFAVAEADVLAAGIAVVREARRR